MAEKRGVNTKVEQVKNFVTLRGTAHFRGNAVRCAEIKTKTGEIISVSAIPGDIELGAEVEISGPYGIMTTCRGRVVIVEEIKRI